jgi:phosphoserine aminotransferase
MSDGRVLNFSAGPGALPPEVLAQAQQEMLNQRGSGMSVMEMSHRSKAFDRIMVETDQAAREFLAIPEDYKVLFLQGGASLQFTMLAKCFLHESLVADYVTTGSWSQKAIESARLEGEAREIWNGKAGGFSSAPNLSEVPLTLGGAYAHFCMNETIQGVDFLADPESNATWICDMSSCIGSRPMDFSRYAMVYAGAQKNIGPAGLTMVILRPDMLDRVAKGLPPMLDYAVQADQDSRYNTPPCWSIYMAGLVFKHWISTGGMESVYRRNEEKAAIIYKAIDESGGFYRGHADPSRRSRMNVSFVTNPPELADEFVKGAAAEGMVELKGHRSVGGCRASIYNAMPVSGVQKLADYMADFARRKG